MDFAQKLNHDFYIKLIFYLIVRQSFTVFSGNIDCISPLGRKILPSALCQSSLGANIFNVALNPNQYLYDTNPDEIFLCYHTI